MATGDTAAAAGLDVFTSAQDRREGYDNDNIRGDELGAHILTGGHPATRIRSGPTLASTVQADLDYLGGTAVPAATASAAAANANANTRALSYGGDANAVRYAEGPTSSAYGRTVSGGGFFAVWMDAGLQFGRNTSAAKYKEHVESYPVDPARVLALRPVVYHRIGTPEGEWEYGLIADEVEDLVPELCTYFEDEVDGVRYDLLAVALLSVAQDQARHIETLTKRLEALEGGPRG